MKSDYREIKKVMGEPLYYDGFGCPRYIWSDFSLDQARICKCQECGREFLVEIGHPIYKGMFHDVDGGKGHYGDPPRHERNGRRDCSAGDTMSSETRELTKEESRKLIRMIVRAGFSISLEKRDKRKCYKVEE